MPVFRLVALRRAFQELIGELAGSRRFCMVEGVLQMSKE
jgi:hypothetical protein